MRRDSVNRDAALQLVIKRKFAAASSAIPLIARRFYRFPGGKSCRYNRAINALKVKISESIKTPIERLPFLSFFP
jgi:hypothetical protein